MKRMPMSMLLVMTLILSACSSTTVTTAPVDQTAAEEVASTAVPTDAAGESSTVAVSAESAGSVTLVDTYDDAVSIVNQLLLGTLALEDTDQAVTDDQAKTLQPLWVSYQELNQNSMPGGGMGGGMGGPGQNGQGGPGGGGQAPDQGSAPGVPSSSDSEATPAAPAGITPEAAATNDETQTEMDDLLDQIQSAMTEEQIQAIADMQITNESAAAMLEDLDLSMGQPGGGSSGNGNQPAQADGTAVPEGTPPADGQGAGGGPNGSGGNNGGGMDSGSLNNMTTNLLLSALIQSLSEKSGIEVPTQSAPTAGGQPQMDGQAQANAGQTGGGGQPGGGDGQPGGGAPGGSQSDAGSIVTAAAYTLDGETAALSKQTYTASETDESAVYVTNKGSLTLSGATINTSGQTSSQDNSSFYGVNAGVLAKNGGVIDLSDSTISTTGTGANGAFATGEGSKITLTDVTITAAADGGHAVMATLGGEMVLNNVDMNTAGTSSGAIATDRGSGVITVTGGTVVTSGQNSPGIYSTGQIDVTGATISASGSEAAVIEGANTITLTDTDLTTSKEKCGVMIYQSMSGDAEGTEGTFTMTGGSLTYTPSSGPLFYVTNSTANILLSQVKITSNAGELVNAAAGNWGSEGSNGGTVILTADDQALSGSIVLDSISSFTAVLNNASTLEGAIDTAHTGKAANLTLDATSTWTVTGDSYITTLSDPDGISGTAITNIIGNGYTVYYDAVACPDLNGQTYTLSGGGTLTPAS